MKIGFIIPARLKSTRLKKKILLRLGDQSALEWAIDRARSSRFIDEVVVATTNLPSDSEITKVCQQKGVRYFQGDPDDVLLRIKDTLEYFNFDYAVNITPDNTLFSLNMIDLLVSEILDNPDIDYFKFKNPMLGTGLYALKKEALQTMCHFKSILDTEIWGPLFNPKYFNVKEIDVPGMFDSSYRLTMDTEQDFIMLSTVYEALNIRRGRLVELNQIIQFLDINTNVAQINSEITQTTVPQSTIEKINRMFEKNIEEFERAKKLFYKVWNDQ